MLETGKDMDPQSREILQTPPLYKHALSTGVDGVLLSALHQKLKKKKSRRRVYLND